jgi:predicted dehydrogenase
VQAVLFPRLRRGNKTKQICRRRGGTELIMKTLRWGIIGAGSIAGKFARALKITEKYAEKSVFYGVASRSREKAKAFAREYGAEKSFGSYAELAADPNVDAVYIATPMSEHFDNVMMCFDNKKAVLCEKSLTVTADETKRLIDRARAEKLFLMEAMWMKCLPFFEKTLDIVKAGVIGDIRTIRADFSKFTPFKEDSRLFEKKLGGGAYLDLGVYPVSFIAAILGYEPKSILSRNDFDKNGVDRNAALLMDYGKAYATSLIGFDIDNDNRAVIVGEKGRIALGETFFRSKTVEVFDIYGNKIEEHFYPLENGFEYEITEAYKSITAGLYESSKVPLDDTLKVMEILDKCREQGLKQ